MPKSRHIRTTESCDSLDNAHAFHARDKVSLEGLIVPLSRPARTMGCFSSVLLQAPERNLHKRPPAAEPGKLYGARVAFGVLRLDCYALRATAARLDHEHSPAERLGHDLALLACRPALPLVQPVDVARIPGR